MPKEVISNKDSEVIKETKVVKEEKKKAKPEEAPKKQVCPPKVPLREGVKVQVEQNLRAEANDDIRSRRHGKDNDDIPVRRSTKKSFSNVQPTDECSNVKVNNL